MFDVASFSGAWSVRRRIVDHRARTAFAFAGSAVVTRTGFRETGRLRIGDRVLDAERAYGLVVSDGGIAVSHPDGSPFFDLGFAARQAVRHVCGDDIYAGQFIFHSPGSWAELWRVKGPRKRYSSLSLYRRPTVS